MIPEIAGAGEARFGAETALGYDSNIFARGDTGGGSANDDDIDSVVWKTQIWGEVEDELERGHYKLRYSPTFFLNEDDAADNTWNHAARAEGTWRFSPRTNLSAFNDFRFLEKIVFGPGDAATDPNVNDENKETIINTAGGSLRHLFTRRLSGFASANYTIYQYSRSQDEDNDQIGGTAGVNYAVDKQWRVGFGGQLSYRTFDAERNNSAFCGGVNGPRARSLSYSGFASLGYEYDERTSFSAQGGPAQIDQTDWQCTNVGTMVAPVLTFTKQEFDQFTWFASAHLIHRFARTVKGQLGYNRQEGLGNVGTTTINDVVTARLSWQPARLWDVRLRASWVRRVQDAARNPSTDVKVTTDTTTWTVAGSISRQVLERLRVGLETSYRDQNADRDVSNPSGAPPSVIPRRNSATDFDIYRVFAFVTFELDPFRY